MSSLFTTIEEIKAAFFRKLHAGEEQSCPCCGRFAKKYARHLHHSTARQLIQLMRITDQISYAHTSELIAPGVSGSGDFTKAAYFGLIEEAPGKVEGKKRVGYWRLTDKGKRFVRGEETIPKTAYVFDDEVLAFSPEQVTIRDALGEAFDYDALMAR